MVLPPTPVLRTLAADTVVSVQVRDRLAEATDVAILIGALALILLAALLLRLVLRGRAIMEELRRAVHQNIGPVSDRARGISDNVEFITGALRTDVARLTDSVKALTDRLHQASNRMEERIEEFNALMEVVQSEAEDIFIDTAATVRGVREGVREGTRAIGRAPRTPHEEDGTDPTAERALADGAGRERALRSAAPEGSRAEAPDEVGDDDSSASAEGDEAPGGAEAEPTGRGTPRH